jgi:hypothetical protein
MAEWCARVAVLVTRTGTIVSALLGVLSARIGRCVSNTASADFCSTRRRLEGVLSLVARRRTEIKAAVKIHIMSLRP